MNKKMQHFINLEEDFFDIDRENKIAHMKLEFDSPDDIFDTNAITKTPIFNDDFTEWMQTAFEYTPSRYKIDLDVSFKEMNQYTSEDLKSFFLKNIVLEYKREERKTRLKNRIAFILIGIGLVSLIALLLITTMWKDGGVVKEVFTYISDIATTVTFWEALTILVVENTEKRNYMRCLSKKFKNIEFHKKEKKKAD